MKKKLLRRMGATMLMAFAMMSASATDIHVATTGSDTNAGTEGAPLQTIQKALELVKAGDRILIHEGTYYITKRLKIPELPTTPDMRCEMRSWPDDAVGKVIIDGSNMSASSENRVQAVTLYLCQSPGQLLDLLRTGIAERFGQWYEDGGLVQHRGALYFPLEQ